MVFVIGTNVAGIENIIPDMKIVDKKTGIHNAILMELFSHGCKRILSYLFLLVASDDCTFDGEMVQPRFLATLSTVAISIPTFIFIKFFGRKILKYQIVFEFRYLESNFELNLHQLISNVFHF